VTQPGESIPSLRSPRGVNPQPQESGWGVKESGLTPRGCLTPHGSTPSLTGVRFDTPGGGG
jgi:hypothetical protein